MRGREEVKGTETIYGLHAVARDVGASSGACDYGAVGGAARDDPRGCERSMNSHGRHNRPIQRVDAHALKQELGDVAHQGVVADITSMPPWTEGRVVRRSRETRPTR